jgi:pSer/pThr/pTyr-binding forkhead associated (FHA) protein
MPRALKVLNGSQQGSVLLLEAGQYGIGTARRAALRLRDKGVSYNHALVVVAGDKIVVEDLRSNAGTQVNGAEIAGAPHVLQPGDELTFGSVRVQLLSEPAQQSEPEPATAPAERSEPVASPQATATATAPSEPAQSPPTIRSAIGRDPRVTELEDQLGRALEQLAEAQTARSNAEAAAEAARTELAAARAAVDAARAEAADERSARVAQADRSEEAEGALATTREQLEESRRQVRELRELQESSDLGPTPERLAELEQELQTARTEADELRAQLEEINEELIELSEKLES